MLCPFCLPSFFPLILLLLCPSSTSSICKLDSDVAVDGPVTYEDDQFLEESFYELESVQEGKSVVKKGLNSGIRQQIEQQQTHRTYEQSEPEEQDQTIYHEYDHDHDASSISQAGTNYSVMLQMI